MPYQPIHDARRTLAALKMLIEAHECVMQSLVLGLPVPDTSEEIGHAQLVASSSAANVIAKLAEREAA